MPPSLLSPPAQLTPSPLLTTLQTNQPQNQLNQTPKPNQTKHKQTKRASEKCKAEKRKTISGDDVLWALETLSFGEYLPALRIFLQKYRDAEEAAAGKGGGGGAGAAGGGGSAAKRAKTAAAAAAEGGGGGAAGGGGGAA